MAYHDATISTNRLGYIGGIYKCARIYTGRVMYVRQDASYGLQALTLVRACAWRSAGVVGKLLAGSVVNLSDQRGACVVVVDQIMVEM